MIAVCGCWFFVLVFWGGGLCGFCVAFVTGVLGGFMLVFVCLCVCVVGLLLILLLRGGGGGVGGGIVKEWELM